MEAEVQESKKKTTKAIKTEMSPEDIFNRYKETGIPCQRVVFNTAVMSWNETPEYAFYAPSLEDKVKKSRVANMWHIPGCGVAWEYNGKRGFVENSQYIRYF